MTGRRETGRGGERAARRCGASPGARVALLVSFCSAWPVGGLAVAAKIVLHIRIFAESVVPFGNRGSSACMAGMPASFAANWATDFSSCI